MNFLKKQEMIPILLILCSDHQIEDINSFQKSILDSIRFAENGDLVIFGVTPTYPATGYRYIKSKNTCIR